MSAIATLAPCLAKDRATLRPSPLAPPITKIIFPSKQQSGLSVVTIFLSQNASPKRDDFSRLQSKALLPFEKEQFRMQGLSELYLQPFIHQVHASHDYTLSGVIECNFICGTDIQPAWAETVGFLLRPG